VKKRSLLKWACLLAIGCGAPMPQPAPPEPPLVTVEPVIEREMDSFNEFTGYLKAVETQEIRTQVTGYLKSIAFKDGALVKEGDVLFQIDPEPYEAALLNARALSEKSKADIVSAQAVYDRANLDYDRALRLRDVTSLGVEEMDARRAAKDSASASLSASKSVLLASDANLKKAQFDLNNCTVKSEVKGIGQISRTLLTKGNLVTAGQTLLCKITSIDPIYAYWDLDETTSLAFRRQIDTQKKAIDPKNYGLKCWIGLKDQNDYPFEGKVDYVSPEISRNTGSREVRAVFDNKDLQLTPGASIRVKVLNGEAKKVIAVPEVAIISQQRQKLVFVVAKDDKTGKETATSRPVILGPVREVGRIRLQIIESGLKPGEKVIVNGLLRVRDRQEVNPKEEAPVALAK
jgi:multidrug efflux system membrane fusion protein